MRKWFKVMMAFLLAISLFQLPIKATSDTNVALGKPATASSVEDAMPNNTADKTVDGIHDTDDSRWSANRMKTSQTGENDEQTHQWLILDLQASTTTVTQMKVYFFKKVWPSKYLIQTSDTNSDWETLKTIERASGSLQDNHVDTISDVSSLKRYVRFYFEKCNVSAGGNAVSVREIEIMGTQSGLIPVEADPLDYERNFVDNSTTGFEVLYGSGATIAASDEKLQLTFTSARAGVVDKNIDHQVQDGTFESTFIPSQAGKRFGMIMRATDQNHKLLVGVENTNNKWFWEYWNGSNNVWSATFTGPSVNANEEVHMKVKLLGTKVTLWVNDTQVFSQTMSGNVLMQKGYFGFDKNSEAGTYAIKSLRVKEQLESASSIMTKVQIDDITSEMTQFPLPEVSEDYTISVIGSDAKQVISQTGKITQQNITDKKVNVLVSVQNKTDETDSAKKSFEVIVPAKTSNQPLLYPSVDQPNEKPMIIPTIQEWYGLENDFTLTNASRIIYQDVAKVNAKKAVDSFKNDIKTITGSDLEVVEGTKEDMTENDIFFESTSEDIYDTGKEGYFMRIDNGIHISSSAYTGLLYAGVTLEQILYLNKDQTIPCGIIRDYPDYEIRGLMFDVGRIPHRIQYLKDYVQILKWYKMNEFHLHMNDDFNYSTDALPTNWSTWTGMHRLESDIYPSLTNKQAYSGDKFNYFNEEYADPTYSKEEYRDLQSMADGFGIDLISEFDTPSHSTAYIEYANENPDNIEWLGPINTTTSSATNNRQMLALDIESANETEKQHALNARKFIEELYKDYLGGDDPLFTSDTVHVGADEYWDKSNPEAFRKYVNFLSDLMASYGKTARMWGAQKLFPGTTPISPENIVIDLWATYEDDPIARLNEGYRIVNVPQPYLYTTPGRDHKDMVGEEYLYKNWDVTVFNYQGNAVADAGEPLLLGAKAALWGDEFREGMVEADLNERMLRAAAMVSLKTWDGDEEYNDYLSYQKTFDALKEGINTSIAYENPSKSSTVVSYDANVVDQNVVKDLSGNENHAQSSITIKNVNDEKAFVFDGTNSINTPLKSIGYPYTLEMNVTFNEGNTNGLLLSGYDGQLFVEENKLGIRRSFFTQKFNYTFNYNTSYNIKIVGTQHNTKLYINDELVEMMYSSDSGQANEYFTTFVLPFEVIGKNFKGSISSIKVMNKALQYNQIKNSEEVNEVNVALNKNAYAERFGTQPDLNTGALKRHPSWKATDGDTTTSSSVNGHDPNSYWLSSDHNDDYLMVDLEDVYKIHKVKVDWENNQHATQFKVLVSLDGKAWDEVANQSNSAASTTITFDEKQARYVKIQGVSRNSTYYAISEVEVYSAVNKTQYKEDLKKYDPTTEAYTFALALADDVTATQPQLDEVIATLDILQDERLQAEKAELEALINEYASLVEDDYTAESWANYAAKLNAANAVIEAIADQSVADVKKAKEDLKAAYEGLEEKPVVVKPAKVTGLKASKNTYSSVKLTWNKVAGASGYEITRSTKEDGTYGNKVTVKDVNTAIVNKLKTGQTYWFKVRAINGDVKGDDCEAVSQKPTMDIAPVLVSVTQKTYGTLQVTWKGVPGAQNYYLERRKAGTKEWKHLKTFVSKARTAESRSLETGTKYEYRVRAGRYKGDAKSPYSNIKGNTPVMKTTTVSIAKKTATSAKVSWKTVSGASGYEVYRATSSTGKYSKIKTLKADEKSLVSSSLKKGKTYYYKVRAYRNVSGKKVYNKFSKVVSYKVK